MTPCRSKRKGARAGFKRLGRASGDAVRRAGLEEDLAIAKRYTGEAASGPAGPGTGVPEPNAPERIRLSGGRFH